MATEPIGTITGAGGLNATTAAWQAHRATAASTPAATAAAPDGNGGIAERQALDARHDGWKGVVSGDDAPRASQESGNVADKGADVTDAELQRLFGSSAPSVRQLLTARSDLKVGDLLPLRKDQNGLHSLSDLLSKRSDVKLADVLSRDAEGKIQLDPTVRDESSREFMYNRTDVKPGELTAMRSQLARQFDNPALARQAYGKSLDLLRTRTDMRPTDVGAMISKMGGAVKGTKQGAGPEGGAALFDMFDKGAKLLKHRTDLGADDVGRLVDATSKGFGGKDGGNGLSNLRDAFSSATDLLQNREGTSVRGVTDVMDTVDRHFGKDTDNKAAAFGKAADLMKSVPQMDAQGINTMFKKSAEGPPAQQGDKLLQAFDNAAGDVKSGKTNIQTATTLKAQQTDRQQHEQKTSDEQIRVNMGRLRTPQEQEERDKKDPQGLTPPGQVPTKDGPAQGEKAPATDGPAQGEKTPATDGKGTPEAQAPENTAPGGAAPQRVNYLA